MSIEKVELLVCDNCNCISTGNPEEKVSCMECGETMARVEFVRQPTPRAAYLPIGSPCPHGYAKKFDCPDCVLSRTSANR